MMRIGFSAAYGFSSIEDVIEFAAGNGFNAVEINLNMPEFFPERYSTEKRRELKKFAEDKDLIVTFHAPEDIDLCTKQKYILDASIKILKECIDFACDLGGTRLTFHIGDSVNFTMYDGNLRLEDYYMEDYASILENAMEELCSYAGDRIILCVENTGYFSEPKMKAVESMLGKGLYLTWDLGHSYIKKNQIEFMRKNIEYVRNAHLHDVRNGKDHCIIGTGEFDIKNFMSLMDREDVTYIIEVRPAEAAVESFDNLKKINFRDPQQS